MAKSSKTAGRTRTNAARQKEKPRQSVRTHARGNGRRPRKLETPGAKTTPQPSAAGPAERATEFTFHLNPTLSLLCLPAETSASFSLDLAADLTGVHPELLRYYCRRGLLGEERSEAVSDPIFDEAALQEVRRIEYYRRHLAVGRRALPLLCGLRHEAERQHIEIAFLRGP